MRENPGGDFKLRIPRRHTGTYQCVLAALLIAGCANYLSLLSGTATTMSALLGTLPIAVGFGMGSESRRPLGLAVVGGLLFSQFLTLFVTPVFFLYLDRLQALLGGRKKPPIDSP